jgi:hypothetical protein
MKKMKRVLMLLLAVGLIFSLAGCPPPDDNGGNGGGESATVEWTNFTGVDRSISVTNNTNERLVAFKGTPSVHTLISGIPGNANNHGLKRGGAISSTGDFPLVLVREAVFNTNNKDLSKITVDDYFTTIWAFFNTEASNDTVFQISSLVGGEGELILINMTAWNVEIREGAAEGQTLGFIGPSTPRAVIRLGIPADYNFFPVFRRMHPISKEIITVTPRFAGEGPLQGQPYLTQIGLSSANRTETFNVGNVVNAQAPSLTLGGVWIMVNNMTTGTGIQFQQGGTEYLTTHGVRTIPFSRNASYQINFPRNASNQFPPTHAISGLYVGPGSNLQPLGAITFELDTEYEIRVGGTDANNVFIIPITAQEAANNPLWNEGDIVRKIGKIDVDHLFNFY